MLNSIISSGLTIQSIILCCAVSILVGLLIAYTHSKTADYSKNFAITLAVLPILVQITMMMVNGNLGTGVAILGAFSLVRFRSIPGTSREIVSVFFAMAVGLATGTGYVWFAIFSTILISLVLFVLSKLPIFTNVNQSKILKITISEDIDHNKEFEPIFKKYEIDAKLEKIKTKNMGSLFELSYKLNIPNEVNHKTFIDELRVRNNNLAISLIETISPEGL